MYSSRSSLNSPRSGSLSASSTNFTSTPSSPLPPPINSKSCMSAAAKRWKYLRRILHYRQMDFEFAFWQMIYLMTAPQKVYRNFQYRKQTKHQYARDDPAFLVLLSGWLVISTAIIAFIIGLGFFRYLQLLMYVIFVDCILAGIIVCTILWFLSNKYLIQDHSLDVEWGFCFDVHLNAFFPALVILHFVMLLFYHLIISGSGIFATLFGNTLWLIGLGYYIYITFLGYSSLNILRKTKIFLYPIVPLILFYVLTLFINWNLSKSLIYFYGNRLV